MKTGIIIIVARRPLFCVTTSKQTTKQHPRLGDRFLTSKYMQQLQSSAFANKHVPTESIGATIEELCFLLIRAERLSMGLIWSLVVQRVVGYSPDSNEASAEAEESPLFEAVTRERLKTQRTEKILRML
jgi:hypothetical protein